MVSGPPSANLSNRAAALTESMSAAPSAAAKVPVLVATLGTDHHRFDRLVDWLDQWLARNPSAVHCLVQHGSSRKPLRADAVDVVPHEDLLQQLAAASIVVSQAGPGSIRDARSCGIVPIVVPRLATLDEVVDDHQVAFARRMHDDGVVILAQSSDELSAALDAALRDPATVRRPPPRSSATKTAARVEDALTGVMAASPGFVSLRRLRHTWRRT
jgi:UDP-N-acetylglucosamine transferase subunit ALG13